VRSVCSVVLFPEGDTTLNAQPIYATPHEEIATQPFALKHSAFRVAQQKESLNLGRLLTIPQPTHCPKCRNMRRMAWRNDRSFYVRQCDLSGQRMVAIYPDSVPFPVYHPSEWYSDKWNALDYGKEVDLSRSFFEQWHELMLQVPRLGVDIVNCENSDYCNYCGDDKNCYLDIAGEDNEDCYFNLFVKHSENCLDCTFVYHSTLCYECISCYNCYNCRWGSYLDNCSDCDFCFDLKGCTNCAFCYNIRNKEYHYFNQKLAPSEYRARVSTLQLGSYAAKSRVLAKWREEMGKRAIFRDSYLLNCENCLGNDIKNSKNCYWVFNATNCEDCRYLYDVLDAKDCQDLNYSLYKPELSYELISTLQLHSSAFNMASHYCSNVYYCDLTNNSSNLFGCIGLNRKSYCILNKQYNKLDYEELLVKIIEMMKARGEWGEFFPMALSPFAYNETVAVEYVPWTREAALAKGCRWKEEGEKSSNPATIVLADEIDECSSELSKELLVCQECTKNYRIIRQELVLYQKQRIPLPRLCPQCRHLERMNLRTPRELWQRDCAKCKAQVLSAYAVEVARDIYCERCYLEAISG
jgi:Zn ribbon nucleic-acid-binding protein